jgi:hypothetical protein
VRAARTLFGKVDWMSESRPDDADKALPEVASDPLAMRLLAAQRTLAALAPGAEVRIRLNLRLAAICTAVKTTGTSGATCLERLDNLIAEAERARCAAPKDV